MYIKRVFNRPELVWFASAPEAVWAVLAVAIIVLVPGVLGWISHQPWLLPSLAATAFIQARTPDSPAARPYCVLVGHALGIAWGWLFLYVLGGLESEPIYHGGTVVGVRLWASVLAVAATMLSQVLVRAEHHPAAATTLLATLCVTLPVWKNVLAMVIGVVLVAVVGEFLRQARLHVLAAKASSRPVEAAHAAPASPASPAAQETASTDYTE